MIPPVIGLLVILVAGGTILAVARATSEARKRAMEAIFRDRGADPRRVKDLGSRLAGVAAVEGRVGGTMVRYGLHTGGKNTPRKTTCEASLSEASPLEMELRPETASEIRNLEHGRAVDLVLGEAAPSGMARALLDRNTRTALLSFHPCVVTVAGDKVKFTKTGYLEEPAEIARVVDMCAELAARLQVLPAQLHEERVAASHEVTPAGYRGASPASMRALQTSPRDADELGALHQARAKRAQLTRFLNLAILVLAIVAGVVMATLARR
jgi:hypothetical protein